MTVKDFDAERKVETHSFKLGGQTFHAYTTLSVTAKDTEGEDITPLERTFLFIRSFIVMEDRPAWDEMVANPETYLNWDDLFAVSNWLIKQATRGRQPQSTNGTKKPRVQSGAPKKK